MERFKVVAISPIHFDMICLYCGEIKQWNEETKVHLCHCDSATKAREIEEQISYLKSQMPKPHYRKCGYPVLEAI